MARINYCAACNNKKYGVKTRIAVPHTCGLDTKPTGPRNIRVNIEVIDDIGDEDHNEFIPCSRCDGHPACEDFGCAFDLGLGHLVKTDEEPL